MTQKHKVIETKGITRRVTRSMTTEAARQRVFQLGELLGPILINLHRKKLFLIQRVCKLFQAVITTSPTIQEKMFLNPGTQYLEELTIELVTYNPEDPVIKCTSATLNPDLRTVPVSIPGNLERPFRPLRGTTVSFVRSKNLRPILYRQHISLLDTYLTVPACRRARVVMYVMFGENEVLESTHTLGDAYLSRLAYKAARVVAKFRCHSESGLTLRDLLDEAKGIPFDASWLKGDVDPTSIPKGTLDDFVNRMEKDNGPAFIVWAFLALEGVALPTATEWAAVRSGSCNAPWGQIATNQLA